MGTFRDGVVNAVRNGFCTLLDFEEGYLEFIEQTPLGDMPRYRFLPSEQHSV